MNDDQLVQTMTQFLIEIIPQCDLNSAYSDVDVDPPGYHDGVISLDSVDLDVNEMSRRIVSAINGALSE